MQREQVVEMREHKQLLACSFRTRWKRAHLQMFFYVIGKADLQLVA